jgi:hypothetical protein
MRHGQPEAIEGGCAHTDPTASPDMPPPIMGISVQGDCLMQKCVSIVAGLALLMSIIVAGIPGSAVGAGSENVPKANWPHTIATDEAMIVVYPPQAISWKEYRSLETRTAVGVTRKGAKKPVLGTLEVTADTHTDFDTRTVVVSNRQVRSSRFPSLDTEQAAAMEQLVQRAMTSEPPARVPLDTVLLSLTEEGHEGKEVDLKHDPPVIFYSSKPANLIVFDGEPVMSSVQGVNLLFAVNTNWDVFLDPVTSTYHLLDGSFRLSATDYRGPWKPVTKLPAAFNDLPNDQNFEEVKQHIPGTSIKEKDLPTIFVNTQPAVIILTKGAPTLTPIRGTKLLAVSNTDSDLFKDSRDGQYYYLTSGRWFRASSLNGPWTYATPNLPQDFARIPSNPYSYVGHVAYNPYTGTYARGGTAYGPWGGAVSGGAAYNPATGAYGRGAAVYGPNGGVGAWTGYNPSTGTYARGRAAWGPNAASATGSFYNPRTGVGGATAQYSNPYGHWGRSVVSGPGGAIETGSRSGAQGSVAGFRSTSGAKGAGFKGAGGQTGGVVRGSGGNVYAGADGNVYRHTDNGWSKWDNSSWDTVQPRTQSQNLQAQSGRTSVESRMESRSQGELSGRRAAAPTADLNQLNQDRFARTQGFQHQQDFGAWRNSGQTAHDFGHRSFSGGTLGGGGLRGGGFHGGFHRR